MAVVKEIRESIVVTGVEDGTVAAAVVVTALMMMVKVAVAAAVAAHEFAAGRASDRPCT